MALTKSPIENPNAGVAILNAVLGLPHLVAIAMPLARATAVEAIMPWAAERRYQERQAV